MKIPTIIILDFGLYVTGWDQMTGKNSLGLALDLGAWLKT